MKKARDLQRVTPLTMVDLSERFSFDPILRWNPIVENYLSEAYGPQHFSRISKALTRPSCYSCIRVNTLKSSVDFVADKLSAILKEKEAEVVKDSVIHSEATANGNPDQTSRECVGDVLMGSSGSGQVSKCQIPGLDNVLFVRGSGPHVIDYGCSADGKPLKEVIVSRKCAEAVLRGAQIYVPGVLACSAGVEVGDTVAVSIAIEQPLTQDGGWGTGMTRGIVLQGSQIDPLFCERRGLYIGQGKAMLSRAGIFRVLQGVAVEMCNRVFKLPSFHGIIMTAIQAVSSSPGSYFPLEDILHDVLEGEIFLQNLPSIVTANALDPKSGERILDMCAAPGGKTTAIAILMKDEGEIIACDRSHNKVNDIQKLASELGLKCITTYKLDALKSVRRRSECDGDTTNPDCSTDKIYVTKQSWDTTKLQDKVNASSISEGLTLGKASEESVSNEKANERTYISKADIRKELRRMKNGPGRNQGTGGRAENSNGFDLDSFDRVLLDGPCSALGLRPRLFAGEVTLESLRNHAKYQKKMFDQAVRLVRPGGVLVYSTCTINPGENEALVRYALDKYKFLSLAPQHPKIGGPGLVGHFKYPDGYVEEWLRPGEEELVQRFDPSSSLDTIGFFIAKFSVATKET